MEEDFYASIKLKTGEEIFARVLPCDENNKISLILTNPIIVENYKGRGGIQGYKIEPWLKTTTEDMFMIKMEDIITITENTDMEMIFLHESYVRKVSGLKNNKSPLSREMGYISNVNEAKKLLEKIYKEL
jgi:hypothetical protein